MGRLPTDGRRRDTIGNMLTDLDREFIEVVSGMFTGYAPEPIAEWPESAYIASVYLGRLLATNNVRSIDEICAAVKASIPPHVSKPFDPSAFFRAIAEEALGGAKVSEKFARFVIGGCGRECGCGATRFTVPTIAEPLQHCPRCGQVVAHYTSHQIMGQGEIEGYTCAAYAPRFDWEANRQKTKGETE